MDYSSVLPQELYPIIAGFLSSGETIKYHGYL